MHQLILTIAQRAALWDHLLGPRGEEEAAFVFACHEEHMLVPRNITFVPQSGYRYKSRFGFELTGEFRAAMIKEAHQGNTIMVEFHSHPYSAPAAFSPTDIEGFREFVPHVRWRLKGRAYGAVVVSKGSFDGVLWEQAEVPAPLTLRIGGTVVLPSRATDWNDEPV